MIIYHGGVDLSVYPEATDLMLTYYDFHKSNKPDKRFQEIVQRKKATVTVDRNWEFPMIKDTIKVKAQEVTDKYGLYCGDSCTVLQAFRDNTVGHILYSPPFSQLYSYSSSCFW